MVLDVCEIMTGMGEEEEKEKGEEGEEEEEEKEEERWGTMFELQCVPFGPQEWSTTSNSKSSPSLSTSPAVLCKCQREGRAER